jgi:adenosine deaminase
MQSDCLKNLCYGIPKAELHLHIEGTFKPELILQLANRNNIKIPYESVEELRKKYIFHNLQEFLDIYYFACTVLIKEEDFSDLMYAYLTKAHSQGLVYAEIFFDPQSHTKRGILFETVLNGLKKGIERGKKEYGIEANLVMCLLRHLSEEEGLETLKQAESYKNDILAVGLDSSEVGNPPEKFKRLFHEASLQGYRLCAHAGEEGSHEYVSGALDELNAERIDHGYNSKDSADLLKRLAESRVPLTLCPLSNKKLMVCPDLTKYPLRLFLEENILATINSDDPSYFGGYIGDNYLEVAIALNLTKEEIVKLAKNSFEATFLTKERKDYYINKIYEFVENN